MQQGVKEKNSGNISLLHDVVLRFHLPLHGAARNQILPPHNAGGSQILLPYHAAGSQLGSGVSSLKALEGSLGT
jgi:hypothetical protein